MIVDKNKEQDEKFAFFASFGKIANKGINVNIRISHLLTNT
jgi:hypothetical protein